MNEKLSPALLILDVYGSFFNSTEMKEYANICLKGELIRVTIMDIAKAVDAANSRVSRVVTGNA